MFYNFKKGKKNHTSYINLQPYYIFVKWLKSELAEDIREKITNAPQIAAL